MSNDAAPREVRPGFWSRVFSSRPPPPSLPSLPKGVRFPFDIDVAPGRFGIRVYSHSLNRTSASFWTFVTHGLAAIGQREIVLTLRRRAHEKEADIPKAVVSFLGQVHKYAQRGQYVGPGEWTEFGTSGFLEPHIRGVAYAAAQAIATVDEPEDALTAILLNSDELETAKAIGIYRILARLGQATAQFPFPPWSDRDRASVVSSQTDPSTILSSLACFRIPGVYLQWDTKRDVRMLARRQALEPLQGAIERLSQSAGFALIVEPAPQANGWLIWHPSQKEPVAITAPGAAPHALRVAGMFLAVASGVGQDLLVGNEDGFALLLKDDSWTQFRNAIFSVRSFHLPGAEDSMTLQFDWIDETSHP